MSSIVAVAKCLAIEAHAYQMYGDLPYRRHLEDVVSTLYEVTDQEEILAAGWLHDAIEDTELSLETIRNRTSVYVGDLVWAVTGVGKNRKERLADVMVKIPRVPGAALLKLADRYSNVRANVKEGNSGLFSMYKKEWPLISRVLPDPETCELRRRLDTLMEMETV